MKFEVKHHVSLWCCVFDPHQTTHLSMQVFDQEKETKNTRILNLPAILLDWQFKVD